MDGARCAWSRGRRHARRRARPPGRLWHGRPRAGGAARPAHRHAHRLADEAVHGPARPPPRARRAALPRRLRAPLRLLASADCLPRHAPAARREHLGPPGLPRAADLERQHLAGPGHACGHPRDPGPARRGELPARRADDLQQHRLPPPRGDRRAGRGSAARRPRARAPHGTAGDGRHLDAAARLDDPPACRDAPHARSRRRMGAGALGARARRRGRHELDARGHAALAGVPRGPVLRARTAARSHGGAGAVPRRIALDVRARPRRRPVPRPAQRRSRWGRRRRPIGVDALSGCAAGSGHPRQPRRHRTLRARAPHRRPRARRRPGAVSRTAGRCSPSRAPPGCTGSAAATT